jgi:hypothetical protein
MYDGRKYLNNASVFTHKNKERSCKIDLRLLYTTAVVLQVVGFEIKF